MLCCVTGMCAFFAYQYVRECVCVLCVWWQLSSVEDDGIMPFPLLRPIGWICLYIWATRFILRCLYLFTLLHTIVLVQFQIFHYLLLQICVCWCEWMSECTCIYLYFWASSVWFFPWFRTNFERGSPSYLYMVSYIHTHTYLRAIFGGLYMWDTRRLNE